MTNRTLGVFSIGRSKEPTIAAFHSNKIEQSICDRRLWTFGRVKIGNYETDGLKMLLDTGATDSVIFIPDMRKQIGIEPSSTESLTIVSGDLQEVGLYDGAELWLSNSIYVKFPKLGVIDLKPSLADVIIGMDVLSQGKLIVDGVNGRFSFEISFK